MRKTVFGSCALTLMLLTSTMSSAQTLSGTQSFLYSSGATTKVLVGLDGFYGSFWKLADTSDSIGSLTLTNTNAVSFSAGKIGNAANFTRTSSQNLSRAAVTFTGPSFTVSMWFRTTTTANAYLFSWNGLSAGNVNVTLNSVAAGHLYFFTDSGASKLVDVPGSWNDGAYHLVVAYHDSVSGANTVVIDNGSPVTVAGCAGVASATTLLTIGTDTGVGGTAYFDGQIDSLAISDNKVPTTDQVAAIWNAGSGYEP